MTARGPGCPIRSWSRWRGRPSPPVSPSPLRRGPRSWHGRSSSRSSTPRACSCTPTSAGPRWPPNRFPGRHQPRAGPGLRAAGFPPHPLRPPAGPAVRRRGRAGRQQQRRRRPPRAGRAGPGPGGAGQQGRERRDRRRLPRARGHGAVRRAPGGRRHDEPDPAGRLRAGPAAPRRRRGPGAQGAPVELPGRRLRGGHDDGRAGRPARRGARRRRHRLGPARRRLPVVGRRSARRGWRASRPPARPSPPAPRS